MISAPHKSRRPRLAFRCAFCRRHIQMAILGMCQCSGHCYHCGAEVRQADMDAALATHGPQAVHPMAEGGIVVRIPRPGTIPSHMDTGYAFLEQGKPWPIPGWIAPPATWAAQAAEEYLAAQHRTGSMEAMRHMAWGWFRCVPVPPDQVDGMGFARRLEHAAGGTPGVWWGIEWSMI